MNGISVIVCCYNSAERLPETIKHIADQDLPQDVLYEVLIVNNASTDNTTDVALTEWQKYNVNADFRIINEYKTGLNNARLRGANEAKYECIIFCDDDNWLCSNYLINSFNIINSDPQIGALGGQSKARFKNNIQPPDWFSQYQLAYAVGTPNKISGDITNLGYVWGAGMVTRKSLYLKAFNKFPSTLSGRKGKKLFSGEDSEYCSRLILMNLRLFYSEALQFIHYIPTMRLDEQYRDEIIKGFQASSTLLSLYGQLICINQQSHSKKLIGFLSSLLKYVLCKLNLFKKTTVLREASILFFYTGLSFTRLPYEVKSIYSFSRYVRNKNRHLSVGALSKSYIHF